MLKTLLLSSALVVGAVGLAQAQTNPGADKGRMNTGPGANAAVAGGTAMQPSTMQGRTHVRGHAHRKARRHHGGMARAPSENNNPGAEKGMMSTQPGSSAGVAGGTTQQPSTMQQGAGSGH